VKPRKSFGTEGAERFNGRMGGERHREDRRFKDREERDTKERPRGFDTFSRDKEKEPDLENARRNGNGRGRNEPSWFRDNNDGPPTSRDRNSNGDRQTDRSRGWREKDPDDRGDRGDRGDRRWDRDRDQRQERDPEWMDEPLEEKGQTHTQEDFQKWKELMQGKDKPAVSKASVEDLPHSKVDELPSFFTTQKTKPSAPPIDTGPDRFFGMWATPKDEGGLTPALELSKEASSKSAIPAGKSSRFTSFFSQDDTSRKVEPQTAIPGPTSNGLESLLSNNTNNNNQASAEKEAFQALLQKLQRQSMGSTPPANPLMQPKPPTQEQQPGTPFEGPEPFQQYRPERQDELRSATRSQPQNLQDLLNQRQSTGSQPTLRPEQMLQDLVGQRQNAFSQTSLRPDQPQRATSNTEFLMNLMQSAKVAPDPQRTEQVLLGLPPKQQMNRQLEQHILEREQHLQREAAAQRDRSGTQRRPPGFFDEPSPGPFRPGPGGPPQHENSRNPPQPTQILQRPPPPGLEQLQQGWPGQGPPPSQLPPPQQLRHIAPPPGLAGGGGAPRGLPPMPQQMFPPGFPMGAPNFPPPDLVGPPPRMPPGYFNAPPPGFPPPGMSPFSAGPEGLAFPFDGRGGPLPGQGGFRR
jgi:hypothetical protein